MAVSTAANLVYPQTQVGKQLSSHPVWANYMVRASFSGPALMDQWRGVYHASAMPAYLRWDLLMTRKRNLAGEKKRFAGNIDNLKAQFSQFEKATQTTPSAKGNKQLMLQLCRHGLVTEGMTLYDDLSNKGEVSRTDAANVIEALGSPELLKHVAAIQGNYDASMATRLMGDRAGADRYAEAERVFDSLKAGVADRTHYNALMQTALTCGYDKTKAVSEQLYDAMGAHKVQPNVQTYRLLIESLAAQGDMTGAQSIFSWLASNHGSELNIELYNQLLQGYRLNKQYHECDQLWNHLVDRRYPSPNLETCEVYLRSIIDLTYTPTTQSMNLYGQIHQVEKKRIPLVLTQMEQLGVPRQLLSPPLLDEVEDALRKFVITQEKFYNWGRSVKLFSFIEYRRKLGFVHDTQELNPNLLSPSNKKPSSIKTNDVIPVGKALLPEHFSLKEPWERLPLQEYMNVSSLDDPNQGGANTATKYSFKEAPIHHREENWRLERPGTRYDPMYGQSKVLMERYGVRRHLFNNQALSNSGASRDGTSTVNSEHPLKEEIEAKDTSILKGTLNSARRARIRVEQARTHRNAVE